MCDGGLVARGNECRQGQLVRTQLGSYPPAIEKNGAVADRHRLFIAGGNDKHRGTRICLDCGSKVLKLPYPGTPQACANVTRMAGDVPWAVLSAGVNHEKFLGQVEIAMQNGASGVIAGRSLWKDCISLDRDIQRQKLQTIAVLRLHEI